MITEEDRNKLTDKFTSYLFRSMIFSFIVMVGPQILRILHSYIINKNISNEMTEQKRYEDTKKYFEIDEYVNDNTTFNLKEIKNMNEYIVCNKIITEISKECEKNPIIKDYDGYDEKVKENIQKFLKKYKYKL